ncbi:DUF2079 domain-containing protein [Microcoleus sp. FACHB-SPT15]|nr:DUF2079 domain-containing protein [Microcoleus sp. FACHB-SPT15]
MICVSALILFVCSSVRHALFQSSAFDLGIYDQVIYLMSQGQPPISSFLGFHHLGNHTAYSVYLLGLLYKIYPTIHWLFAVQAIGLSLGALPIWHLARHAGLNESQATAMAAVYLLYPLIFNLNIFDFHPEVMAVSVILGAVLAARLGKVGWFCCAIFFVLGCKAALSLTVVAMGVWLLVFEKKRVCGAIAIVAGVAWFIIATQIIIPQFSGTEAAAVFRYAYLGDSVLDIAKNLLFKPNLVLGKIFSLGTLEYLALLLSPVIWGLSPRYLTPLVAAIPALTMNILAAYPYQRDLIHQYSLPVLPFLLLSVIATLAAGKGLLRNKREIILWSLVAFLALAKFGYFWSRYLRPIETWQATKDAIALVKTKEGVLASAHIAPHLTHRTLIKAAFPGSESADLNQFRYVVLNVRYPGLGLPMEVGTTLVKRLSQTPEFRLSYQRDDVFVFEKVADS